MDRRLFLAALGGSIASGASAGHAAVRNRPRSALISTYVTNIADAHILGSLPQPGSGLTLRVDAGRVYDSRSVLVSTEGGEALGYLPSIHSRTIEPLLSGGFAVEARVVSSKTTPRPAMKIEISLQPAPAQMPA